MASTAARLQSRIFSDIAQPAAADGSLLSEWINPQYLDESLQTQAQDEFEDESRMLLFDFIKPERLASLAEASRGLQLQPLWRIPAAAVS